MQVAALHDTTKIIDAKTKKLKVHYLYKYDFDDYEGGTDYSKMFVTKLMLNRTGQCHSLPLLFLVLAQQFGANAYLSFSPNHSFIRFKDDKGKMRNIELTNHMLTSDAFVIGSGYVKSEALKSKIYLDTFTIRQAIAECFVDLAHGYVAKNCYDDFVLKCTDEALKYIPNDIVKFAGKIFI